MALMPRRVKHRKSQRRRIKGNASRGNTVSFGDWGLQSLDPGHITGQTIEACRIAATQYVRGEGKVYIRIFPQKSVTARPLETRMGKGKGDPDRWVAVIRPGTIMFELTGVDKEAARDCFNRVAHKLPVRVRLVGRRPKI
ncbi:50S ribosomal protein L16 [Polystyrenella longa]|uniref:Large ribosomal subunit protein uL16 n=1 Tax=Polystyrenella longa TaxID=2528007 RepID=A0A518CR81_9PLAN|nr:50S ribosomal protein L16 [Polystyrenella longa]QDU81742.1 50S ribosomal protein L16 [Polystyrenella longa]